MNKISNKHFDISTHQIYDNIFAEFRSPFRSDLGNMHHSLWVICVYVKDRGVDDTGNVGTVGGGAGGTGICGKANLQVAMSDSPNHANLASQGNKNSSTEQLAEN